MENNSELSKADCALIKKGVKRVFKEYGEVLKWLGCDEKLPPDHEFEKFIAQYERPSKPKSIKGTGVD